MKCPKCGESVIFEECGWMSGIVHCPKCHKKMPEKEAKGAN